MSGQRSEHVAAAAGGHAPGKGGGGLLVSPRISRRGLVHRLGHLVKVAWPRCLRPGENCQGGSGICLHFKGARFAGFSVGAKRVEAALGAGDGGWHEGGPDKGAAAALGVGPSRARRGGLCFWR